MLLTSSSFNANNNQFLGIKKEDIIDFPSNLINYYSIDYKFYGWRFSFQNQFIDIPNYFDLDVPTKLSNYNFYHNVLLGLINLQTGEVIPSTIRSLI
mgnify:CR=1 FL=1